MPEKIIVQTDLPPDKALLELAYIVKHLRESSNKWQIHFGSTNRNIMRGWEAKADDWIEKHIVKEDN